MTVFVREILFDQQRMHFICLNNLHKGNKSIFEIKKIVAASIFKWKFIYVYLFCNLVNYGSYYNGVR